MTATDREALRRQHELDAAERQGLLVLLMELERQGGTADIENTGGYCMALVRYVLAEDGSQECVVASHDDRW